MDETKHPLNVIFFLFLPVIIVFYVAWENDSNLSQQKRINSLQEEYPEITPLVKELSEDGFSKEEYHIILNKTTEIDLGKNK